jgi:dTDP-4-dehydrorhamnose reductase
MNATKTKSVVLITGAGGQLGASMTRLLAKEPDFDIISLDYSKLDITNSAAVEKVFAKHQFDWVINCAGYTNVDEAEKAFEKVLEINAIAVGHLAYLCKDMKIPLIHFSSDYVYHNQHRRPLEETDPTTPQSIYAQSKLSGEEIISEVLEEYLIFRTSWLYSADGHNFVNTMLRLGKQGKVLKIVNDQIGTPTLVDDIAEAVLAIIVTIRKKEIGTNKIWGTFNMSNQGETNWYAFAQEIFRLSGMSVSCTPVDTKTYNAPASRPLYSVLSNQKLKDIFGIELRNWQTALNYCLQSGGYLKE